MDDRLHTTGRGDAGRRRHARSRGWLIAGAAWLAAAVALAAPDAPLDSPVSALWSALPLRAWADRATALAGRPVILDRRIDPGTTVTRDCRGEPLGAVLDTVAADAGAAVEPLRSSIRIVPTAVAGRATAGERDRAAEIARLPAAARGALVARAPWTWADGARPRDLVGEAARASGLAVAGLETVPHDHLPAASLEPLALAERLDLVLAHYDLRVAWEAAAGATTAAGRIVPLPDAPPGGVPTRPPRSPSGGKREAARAIDRYSLTLEAPLDQALRALAPRLGLEPDIDRESLSARGVLPGEIVRVKVTDATRDALLDALVAPLGLRWRIVGTRLVIDAPP